MDVCPARLLRALDAAVDGIAVLDDADEISYANTAFADGYGADSPGDVVGLWLVTQSGGSVTVTEEGTVAVRLDAGPVKKPLGPGKN